jgi:hypothetical protein
MIGLQVSISDAKGFINHVKGLFSPQRLLPPAQRSALRLQKVFVDLTPVSKEPDVDPFRGLLKRGWKGEVVSDSRQNRLLILVENRDPRAKTLWPMLLRGTHAHPIHARHKALSFILRSGEPFIGPFVHHPGFPAKVDSRALTQSIAHEMTWLKGALANALLRPNA